MFVISQCILQKSNVCNNDNISTYAIASGMVVYTGIYLYLLFYNNEYVSLFNKFIIYIVGIDLLLSTFYFFSYSKTSSQQKISHDILNNENITLFDQNNNKIDSDSCSESESELDSEYEIEEKLNDILLEENTSQKVDTDVEQKADTDVEQKADTDVEHKADTDVEQKAEQKVDTKVDQEVDTDIEQKVKDLETDILSEPTIKKRRGRKPNSVKLN